MRVLRGGYSLAGHLVGRLQLTFGELLLYWRLKQMLARCSKATE